MTYNCRDCNVELTEKNWTPWYRQNKNCVCTSCKRKTNLQSNPIYNKERKWLNSVYITKNNPLYDILPAGRYKTMDDGSIVNVLTIDKQEQSDKGIIYIVTNPYEAEIGWYKIGKTTDLAKRLEQFNTGRSQRDFYAVHYIEVDNRHLSESDAHEMARGITDSYNKEWFKADPKDLIKILNSIIKKKEQDKPIPYDLFSYAKTGT